MAVTAAEIKAILSAQDQLSATLSRVQGELRNLGTSATTAGSAARSAGPSWVSMTTAIAAGTVAAHAFMAAARGIAGVVGSAGAATTDFGQSMANIRSLIPDADFDRFGAQIEKTALRLGKDYPLSAAEAGAAMELLAQKGISAQKIVEGGAEAVVKLASATGADLVTATGIAAAAMDTFNVPADQMNTVTNLMTGAMIRGGVSATDFGHAFQAGGAVIALAGGSIEDASIAIAAMAKAGIEGSDAGTSLKTMYMNLQPTTKAATAAMLELGLVTKDGRNAFFDARGHVKSFEEISQILARSLTGLTDQQKLATLETIFGSDAIRAAAVAADFGAGKYGNLGEQVRQVDNGSVAAKRMDSLKGSLQQFGGSAETVGITLMGKLGPGLKTVVDTGTELLNQFLDKLDTPEAVAFFESLGQGAKQAGDDLYAAGQSMSELGESLKNIPTFGGPLNTFLQTTGSVLVGLAAILRGDAKGAAEAFGTAIKTLGDGLSGVPGAASGALSTFGSLRDTLGQAADKAGQTGTWETFGRALSNVGETAGDIPVKLDKISTSLGRLNEASGGTGGKLDLLAVGLRTVATHFELLSLVFDTGVNSILTAGRVFTDWVAILANVGRAVVALATGDMPGFNRAIDGAKDALADMALATIEWANDTEQNVRRGARAIGIEISDQTLLAQNAAAINMAATAQAVETSMAAANTSVSEGSAGWQQFMEANGAAMVSSVEGSMTGVTGAVGTGMTQAVAAVEAQAPAAVAAAEQMGTGMATGIEAAAPAMAAAADQGASGAVAAVQAQQGAASGAGQSLGEALGSGLEGGILAYAGRVASAAARLLQAAIAAASGPEGADAHSPSRKMAQLGKDMIDGLEQELGKARIGEELLASIRDFIDATRDYVPVAGEIARVEREIKDIREQSQTDALFRAQEMIDVDSEILRLKEAEVRLERDQLPLRQDLARATREIADIERGSLPDRTQLIEIDARRKELRLQEIELERQLIQAGKDETRRKALQEQIDKLRDQDRLLGLEADKIRTTNELAATAARVRREGLDDQVRGYEAVLQAIRNEIERLDAERAVFNANEAVIKNATDNEIAYRERLIAVFTAEHQPLRDRITAGLALIDQLEKEGRISTELANKLREQARQFGLSSDGARALGGAVSAASPPLVTGANNVHRAAMEAMAMAEAMRQAALRTSALADALGRLPSWFRPTGGGGGGLFNVNPLGSTNVLSGTAANASVDGAALGVAFGGFSAGGRADHLVIDVRTSDREAMRIYVTGKELAHRVGVGQDD